MSKILKLAYLRYSVVVECMICMFLRAQAQKSGQELRDQQRKSRPASKSAGRVARPHEPQRLRLAIHR